MDARITTEEAVEKFTGIVNRKTGLPVTVSGLADVPEFSDDQSLPPYRAPSLLTAALAIENDTADYDASDTLPMRGSYRRKDRIRELCPARVVITTRIDRDAEGNAVGYLRSVEAAAAPARLARLPQLVESRGLMMDLLPPLADRIDTHGCKRAYLIESEDRAQFEGLVGRDCRLSSRLRESFGVRGVEMDGGRIFVLLEEPRFVGLETPEDNGLAEDDESPASPGAAR